MRLTLRTLLAYLDDVLDPADKEELAQKIESSDFAEDLVHRTRDTVRRLRLSAPQLIGTGMGLDPNSVAEYLDNVMPPDAVGDFERICLESDVHLAEAAACHHVLTMILGQPADVDPIARQRMYTISTEAGERKRLRMEPAHTAAISPVVSTIPEPAVVRPAVVQQPRPVEIPEYLRTGGWWKSWGMLAGLAILLVGVGILLATGMPGLFGGKKAEAPQARDTTVERADNATPNAAAEPAAPNPEPPPASMTNTSQSPPPTQSQPAANPNTESKSAPAPISTTATTPPQTSPAPTTVPPATAPPVSPPAPTTTAPPVAAPNTGTVPNPNAPAPGTQPAPANPTVNVPTTPAGPPAATKPPLPPQPGASTPTNTNLATSTPAGGSTATTEGPARPDAGVPDENPPIPPAPELGTYMGGITVLLRYDGKTGAWFRTEPRAAVVAGERLLSLPEFRPKIALVSGINLDMSGGTQIVIGSGSESKTGGPTVPARAAASSTTAVPTVELVYGRLVLTNSTNGENRVRLKLGPNAGEAELGRNATLAVEVERKYVPGQDPKQAAAPIECRLFAPDGSVVWKDSAGQKTIEKASRWTVGPAGAKEPVADPAPPEWIYREPIGQLSEQRDGAPIVERALVSNSPVDTQLRELYQGSKQRYVKSLVARSAIHVGLFVPFVDALRDSEQKANWKTHIDALRAAMALSPESANKVWQTLVDQRGRPAATDLFEMLRGYNLDEIGHTPDQMKDGAVARLIDRLENDSLDYRVLAVQNLFEITGKRYMLNPADSISQRTSSVRKWRERLEKGELKPVPQPL